MNDDDVRALTYDDIHRSTHETCINEYTSYLLGAAMFRDNVYVVRPFQPYSVAKRSQGGG